MGFKMKNGEALADSKPLAAIESSIIKPSNPKKEIVIHNNAEIIDDSSSIDKPFVLTAENYFSAAAHQRYFSVSQYKGMLECEARELAKMRGEYKEETSVPFLVGSYVHSHFNNELDRFKMDHPTIFTRNATLKSEYKTADAMINTLENDEFVMMTLEGESEQIFTGELFGVPWKIMVDRLNKKNKRFIDIKTTRDFEEKYNSYYGRRVNFAMAYNYVIQFAVYREILSQNLGEYYNAFMVAVTKEKVPDKVIASFPGEALVDALKDVELSMQRLRLVKAGIEPPKHCGHCDYCKSTKQLYKVVPYTNI